MVSDKDIIDSINKLTPVDKKRVCDYFGILISFYPPENEPQVNETQVNEDNVSGRKK
jgi:hypothetical protein